MRYPDEPNLFKVFELIKRKSKKSKPIIIELILFYLFNSVKRFLLVLWKKF